MTDSIVGRPDEFLWVEKYRPQTINDCILPQRLKDTLNEMVAKGEIQNIMAIGGAGQGKTTIARALCNELQADFIVINCSENGNIDTLRTDIRQFASSISLTDSPKCVILDEADGLTNFSQNGLRNFIEEFSNNCRFIFTANFGNKIIEPLKSRTVQIDTSLTKEEKVEVIQALDKRLQHILQLEGIEYDVNVLTQLVIKFFPDMRKILNELQRYTMGGKLEADVMKLVSADTVAEIYAMLKGKKFTELRKWVATNPDTDLPALGRMLYNACDTYVKPDSIPMLILYINQYQINATMVADREVNMMAFLVELMGDLEFR